MLKYKFFFSEAVPGNIRQAEHFVNFMRRFIEYLKVVSTSYDQYVAFYFILENNPKQIHALIGLKLCFYNSIETQNWHEVLT